MEDLYTILYYSGAGNTKFIAKKIKTQLKKSYSVDTFKIVENLDTKNIEQSKNLIVGFPIYDLQAPNIVKELLKKLDGKDKNISFFCTKAFMSADSIKTLSDLAKQKGFSVVAIDEYYMPATDMLGVLAKKENSFEKVLKWFHTRNIDKRVETFIKNIELKKDISTISSKWYIPLRHLLPKSVKQSFHDQYTRFVPLFHSIQNDCIECMKCVKECPRENIVFTEKIEFGTTCDMCLHCLHHCPTEAIQIGDMTKDTVRYTKVNI